MPDIRGSKKPIPTKNKMNAPINNINSMPSFNSEEAFLLPEDKYISSPNISFSMQSPTIPSAIPPQSMPSDNVIRNSSLQMLPQEPVSSEDDTNFLGSLIAQGVAGIGTGLMGGTPRDIANSANMFQYMRDQQTKRNKSDLLMDPKSEESKKRRLVYENTLKIKIPSTISALDLEDPNVLQGLKGQMEQPKLTGSTRQGGVSGVGKEKESLTKNPFYKDIVITNNMARSVDNDLNELLDLIKRSGNQPITGADAFRQKQLVGKIAINYNKILDPGSIVKPEEADAIIKQLGLDYLTRDNVSIDSVSAFKKGAGDEAQNRLQGYYGMYSTFDSNEQNIYQNYKDNPTDPKAREAFENIIKLKRARQ